MEDNSIEKLFNETFQDFEISPPDELKSSIDKNLVFENTKKNRFGFWMYSILIFVPICALISLLVYNKSSNQTTSQHVTQKNNKSAEKQYKTSTITKSNTNNSSMSSTKIELKKHDVLNKDNNISYQNRNDFNPISFKNSDDISTIKTSEKIENKTENNLNEAINLLKKSTLILDYKFIHEKLAISRKIKDPNLILMASFGTFSSANKYSGGFFKSEEKGKFQTQLDIIYSFKNSNFGIQTGINYRTTLNEISIQNVQVDSSFAGYTYHTQESIDRIYYLQYGSRFDTILFTKMDTISVSENYVIKKTMETQKSRYRVSSFSIPILFQYSQKLANSKFYLDISAGPNLTFHSIRTLENNFNKNQSFTYQKVTFNALLKSSIRYQLKRIGLGLNVNYASFTTLKKLNEIKQKTSFLDVGVGIFYKL